MEYNRKIREKLKKYGMDRQCKVILTDIKLDKNFKLVGDTVMVSDERRKKYACYICTAKFTTSRELSKHRAMHSDSESEDKADEADEDDIFEEETTRPSKSNSGNAKLAKAVKSNKSVDPEPLSVDVNQKVTSPEVNVDVVETPFKCDTCQIYFATPDDAKLHKSSVKCRFSCKLCNRKLNTLYAFVVHVMQHRVNVVKNQIPTHSMYDCTLCGKSFEDCYQLKRHEVITHKLKPNSATSSNFDSTSRNISSDSNSERATPKTKKPSPVPQYLPPAHKEVVSEPFTKTLVHANEFTCDLCYDIFKSHEELEIHMELHKQLEENKTAQNKADLIVIEDDEDDVVEVIEEKKCASEIITTIKKYAPPKQSKPSTSKTYATLTPLYSGSNTSINKSSVVPHSKPTVSNQVLSDTIKEMLTPNSEKQSKTILLPTPVEKAPTAALKKSQPKVDRLQSVSSKLNIDLELRKTGPLSYSLCYKGDSSLSSSTLNPNAQALDATITTTSSSSVTAITNSFSTPMLYSTTSTSTLENPNPSKSVSSTVLNDNSIKFISQNVHNLDSTYTNTSTSSMATTINTVSSAYALPPLLYTTASASTSEQNINHSPQITTPGVNDNSAIKFVIPNTPNIDTSNSLSNLVLSSNTTNITSSYPSTSVATTTIGSGSIPNNLFLPVMLPQQSDNSNAANTKFAYIFNPTPSTSTSSNLNDQKKIAYIIIPHNQNSSLTNLSTSTSVDRSNIPPLIPAVTSAQISETNTTPTSPVKTTTDISKEPVSTSLSSEILNSPEMQMPLITNVTSLNPEHSVDSSLPVISNVTSITSESTSNVELTVLHQIDSSDILPSKPGPSHENNDLPIVIDSDSCTEIDEDEIEMKEDVSSTSSSKSDSEERTLVIDENDSEKNTTNDEALQQKKGFIFFRDMTELLEPSVQRTQKTKITSDMTRERQGYKFYWRCSECEMVCRRLKAMRNHDRKKHKCMKCTSKFCKRTSLKLHYLEEHNSYFCWSCLVPFTSPLELSQHKTDNHTCKKCFRVATNMQSHVCRTRTKRRINNPKNETSRID